MVKRTLLVLIAVLLVGGLAVSYWTGGIGMLDLKQIVIMKTDSFSPAEAVEVQRLDTQRELRVLSRAVGSAEARSGIVNISEPNYMVRAQFLFQPDRLYFFWAAESGDIAMMRTTDTHRLYTISIQQAEAIRPLLLRAGQ
ncbi:hypothetical protein PA598K_06304 [Paenibacillus sp. 598K]|uniref:hypothetical protein n=1 Tax=Paenibacillus sp. 598K TaxID=1117987 RepID=UPI000FFA3211|nr:hypothetical protein [Paenibacillus sp. 598K]GBF77740.1 hypothetical protein PA598K_06304 [Paenibacillus sp. 598K]